MNKLFNNYNAWDPFELFPAPKEIDLSKFNKVAAGLNPNSALAMQQRTKNVIKLAEDKLIEDTYNKILEGIRKEADRGRFNYVIYYEKSHNDKYLIIVDRLEKMGYTVFLQTNTQSDPYITIKW
jgi:hypothetical protein